MEKKGRSHKETPYFARCEAGGKGCWDFQEDSCKVMVLGAHELKNQFLRLFSNMNMQLISILPRDMEVDSIIPTDQGTHTETGFESSHDLLDSRGNALFPTSLAHTL